MSAKPCSADGRACQCPPGGAVGVREQRLTLIDGAVTIRGQLRSQMMDRANLEGRRCGSALRPGPDSSLLRRVFGAPREATRGGQRARPWVSRRVMPNRCSAAEPPVAAGRQLRTAAASWHPRTRRTTCCPRAPTTPSSSPRPSWDRCTAADTGGVRASNNPDGRASDPPLTEPALAPARGQR